MNGLRTKAAPPIWASSRGLGGGRLRSVYPAENPAEHVAELKAIVRNATKPTEYEETHDA